MSIIFDSIPSNIRTPATLTEINNSKANQGAPQMPLRVLVLGQKTASGAWAANSLQRVTAADQGIAGAGRGSLLHRDLKAYFNENGFTETWAGVLADNGAGAAAVWTITITGPATATGTWNFLFGGELVQVAVTSGNAQNAIAAALNAAINANLDLPVTSSVATNVVTVTYRHKGEVGNDYDIRTNYQVGQTTPAGVAAVIVQLTGGTSNPVLTSILAAMGDTQFHLIAHPYTDATSLTALENELSSRWGPLRQIDGFAIAAASGTQGALATLGTSRNSQFSVIASQPGKSPPRPAAEFAAALTGVIAYYAPLSFARPLQTLPISWALPPAESDKFTQFPERNLLLYSGISTSKATAGGKVRIERVITTYETNAAGAADPSYLDLTTMLTLAYLRYSFRNRIETAYPRHMLMDDGPIPAGQPIITPSIARAEAVAWYQDMVDLALVEASKLDDFKANLVVERDSSDVNRLNFILPPDLTNALMVSAIQIQFRL